jgi:hypothetical protein
MLIMITAAAAATIIGNDNNNKNNNTPICPLRFYSTFTDVQERNCYFPAPGRNCMTHH